MDDKNYQLYWDLWCEKYDIDDTELKYFRKLVDIKDKRILEIGCGSGRFTRKIAKYAKEVVGIDNDPRMIDLAEHKTKEDNISYKLMDALKLDFEKESFDIVVYTWTLAVLHKKEILALKQAKDVIKKDGYLVLIEPGGESNYSKIVRPFIPKEIEEIDIKQSYEIPLKEVFKKDYISYGPIKIPYQFDDFDQTVDVMKFAIEEWHKGSVDKMDQLETIIKKYSPVDESLMFYVIQK